MRENGWDDAVKSPQEPTLQQALPRDEMIALAESKGVKIDRRWSDARLSAEIEKA
jgi:hypothetical protein